MQLFYNPTISENTTYFSFDKEESKHIVKVLRKKDSDILFITNGAGVLYKAKITSASENKCTVQILSFEKSETPQYKLHLAVAPTKMNDRYEWFLEKATEMGIDEITPLLCDRSERKVINAERWDKIVVSAMKQCNRLYLPKLNELTSFATFVKQKQEGLSLIAHCEESDKRTLKFVLQPKESVTVLIGPEGDFSKKEIALALENGYLPVSLGTTRLRTETAALVACHSVVFVNEN